MERHPVASKRLAQDRVGHRAEFDQIHSATEERFERSRQLDEVERRDPRTREELHQQIDVARPRIEVVAGGGAGEVESCDPVASAQFTDSVEDRWAKLSRSLALSEQDHGPERGSSRGGFARLWIETGILVYSLSGFYPMRVS